MGDAFQKKNAWRFALPRMGQASSRIGLLGLIAGTLAALLGADPVIADVVGQVAGEAAAQAGLAVAGASAVALLRDDGTA